MSGAGDQRCILVVEDDADIREVMADVLRDEGYLVEVASNGAEALRALGTGMRPAIILLDLMMPVMDGAAFVRAQKQDPAIAPIPVVVISADGNVPAKASSLGAAGVLRKPVDVEALLALVQRMCS